MTKRVHLPVVTEASQADDRAAEVERSSRLGMPGPAPARPELELPDDGALFALLLEVRGALREQRVGMAPRVFGLDGLPARRVAELDDTLGIGEVDATVIGRRIYRVAETALPGLWRVSTFDDRGVELGSHLEVADVPGVIRAAAQGGTSGELPIAGEPDGTMNARPLLAEIRAHMDVAGAGRAEPGRRPNHVINFTLLPLNQIDMAWLQASLGRGPVTAWSRGYGTCAVELTARRGVWSVQYFNAVGDLVLDTLEVGDVPVAILAGDQDFADSGQRLGELLGVQS